MLVEITADRWCQRFEEEHRKHTSQSVHLSMKEGALFGHNEYLLSTEGI